MFVDGERRRLEHYRDGMLERTIISDPANRLIRTYRAHPKQCLVTPMPADLSTGVWNPDEGAAFTAEESEMVTGHACTRFRVERGSVLAEYRWYDEASGLCLKTQTFDRLGRPVLTIDCSDIQQGRPAESLFEPLAGFPEMRLR
jgi:hypothetical protein